MSFQNMAPSVQRSFALAILFGTVAVVLYLVGVEPAEEKLRRTNGELSELEGRHESMMRNLRGRAAITNRLAAAEAGLAPFREAMIEPFLESYAMRAKTIIDNFALAAGLADVEYSELPPLTLPVPKRLPERLHARQPIRITARGSYQAAVSFLLRVEKELPLVTLEALEITATAEPNSQQLEFILEWPVPGASTKPQMKGGAK